MLIVNSTVYSSSIKLATLTHLLSVGSTTKLSYVPFLAVITGADVVTVLLQGAAALVWLLWCCYWCWYFCQAPWSWSLLLPINTFIPRVQIVTTILHPGF